jgi:hypothetical protein
MTGVGALTPDPSLESYIRQIAKLPELVEPEAKEDVKAIARRIIRQSRRPPAGDAPSR